MIRLAKQYGWYGYRKVTALLRMEGWRINHNTATRRLSKAIGWNSATCEVRDKDRYGRLVAVCKVKEQDLNRQLVMEGLALAYRRYSRDYVEAEKEARKRNVGMWQKEFVKPWD